MRPTLKTFKKWVTTAAPGSSFVYHRDADKRDATMFGFAHELHETGLYFLCQRRDADGRLEYLAQRIDVNTRRSLDNISAAIPHRPSREGQGRRPSPDYIGTSYGTPAAGRANVLDIVQ